MTKRRIVARSSLAAAVLALSVALFLTGKGHTIYLDTNSVGEGDAKLRAPELSAVYVDGSDEPEEMGRAERAIAMVMGARHVIRVESLDGDEKKASRTIRIPLAWSEVVVSIPAIMAGAGDEAVLYRFTAPPRQDEPAELTIQQADSDVIQLAPDAAEVKPAP
ncbi:MAG: hypothetical protein JNG85_09130 [Spirochaetaceae bacterium]|nr:hypothetical protein [Spirochaetaceae bacterium]